MTTVHFDLNLIINSGIGAALVLAGALVIRWIVRGRHEHHHGSIDARERIYTPHPYHEKVKLSSRAPQGPPDEVIRIQDYLVQGYEYTVQTVSLDEKGVYWITLTEVPDQKFYVASNFADARHYGH